MDQELISYLDARFQAIEGRFRENAQQLQDFREETLNRFDRVETRLQRAEDAIRSNQEGIESNRKAIEANSKAIAANETAIRHTDIKVEALRDEIRLVADGVATVDQKLEAFRVEVAKEFEQVRAENRTAYTNLNRRVTRLEQRAKAI